MAQNRCDCCTCLFTCSKNCCLAAVIVSGTFCLFFQLMLIIIVDLSFSYIDEMKNFIFGETPFFNLAFSLDYQNTNLKYIESFYEWQGREQSIKNSNGKVTKKILEKPKNISRIYGNYFLYNNGLKNYFNYINDYSVGKDESCQENYKKCGILNSGGRILCLPNNEECPLNDFAISSIQNDPNYDGYQSYKVTDFKSSNVYYFYYTNTKINNNIITNFKLSYGLPCMAQTEKSWVSIFNYEKENNPSCKTKINEKLTDNRYTKVNGGDISLISLYNDNNIGIGQTINRDIEVQLYTKNYIDINEECNNQFFTNIEKEDKSFTNVEKLIKALGSIIIILLFSLITYSGFCCYYKLKFYWIFIIVPIIGIIFSVIEICFTYTKELKYTCSDEGYNSKLNDILGKDYYNSRSIVMGMGISSIVTLICNIIFCICMKVSRDPIQNNFYNGYNSGMARVNIIGQYPQVDPINNNYGIAKPIYPINTPGNNYINNNYQNPNVAYSSNQIANSNQAPEANINNIQSPSSSDQFNRNYKDYAK